MTATITTPAALIAEALKIDMDDRVIIEVTNSTDWAAAWCEETGAPGAVTVKWVTLDGDLTDRTLSGEIAGDWINALLLSDQVDQHADINIEVAYLYIRFVHPQLADTARYVDMPTRIAA